jgi:hypothetical protein
MSAPKDTLKTLAFNPRRRVLVGGTQQGRVCFWHFIGRSNATSQHGTRICQSIDF